MAEPALEITLPAALPTRWARLVGDEGLTILADIGRSLDSSPGQKALMTPTPTIFFEHLASNPTMFEFFFSAKTPTRVQTTRWG